MNMAKRYFTVRTVLGSLAVGLTLVLAFVLSQHSGAQTARSDDDKQLAPQAGTISGLVFQDFNQNGLYDTASSSTLAIDIGVAGVTVTAYDSSGVQRGQTTSGATGTYTLNATGTGPYRIEFTALPTGYTPSARSTDSVSGGVAANAGSTVQFVNNGTTSNVNLGITRNEEYCEDNPTVFTSRFAQGASNGSYAANPALWDFPYGAGTTYTDTVEANYDNPTTHNFAVPVSAIGATYSSAYNRFNERLYAAAYFKRHSGFGPGADGSLNNSDDPGAVYVINPSTNTVVSTITVPGATANSHNTSDIDGQDNGDIAFDAVGKSSLGGIDLSDDGSLLFVMNLESRRLYSFNTSTGVQVGSTAVGAITGLTLPTPGGSNTNCYNATYNGQASINHRPFAVNYYRGSVYIGMQCTAERRSAGNAGRTTDLFFYLFKIDNPTAATMTINATPVFSTPLNYRRGIANDPDWDAEWRIWVETRRANTTMVYPQPLVSDVEFDSKGNLILGIKDRSGDQTFDIPGNGEGSKRTAGDVLKACGSVGSWTLEANGRCNGDGTAPQNTGQGPGTGSGQSNGSGEFFFDDDFSDPQNGGNYHDEVTWGGLLYVPGRNTVMATLLDPLSAEVFDLSYVFDGGVRVFNLTTGASDRAYRLYDGDGGQGPTFGKVNGLGDMTALCKAAPIELGNRVWRDSNNNGVQDPGEPGIAGVTVHLYDANNVLVGTAVTDANGEYYFVSSTVADPNQNDNIGQVNGGIKFNSNYTIKLDRPQDSANGGPLFGLRKTILDQTTQNGFDEGSDSDGDYDNSGNYLQIPVTTGNPGDNNHNYDFGFVLAPSAAPVSVTGRITTANGNGIRNVRVMLTEEDGTMHYAITGSFGYFVFENIESGQGVVVSVSAKRYTFAQPSRFISLEDNISDADWVSEQ